MNKQTTDAIIQTLKTKGLRITPQRYALYANLLSRTDHPTAEQLLADLNVDFPVSSQATVYASLQALQEVGLVREVLLEEGVTRYDANVQPHHHFRCCGCGSIDDIEWDAFATLDLSKLPTSFSPERYEVTVHGLCKHCSS